MLYDAVMTEAFVNEYEKMRNEHLIRFATSNTKGLDCVTDIVEATVEIKELLDEYGKWVN